MYRDELLVAIKTDPAVREAIVDLVREGLRIGAISQVNKVYTETPPKEG